MALPVSVQQAADYADALEQQMTGQVQGQQAPAEATPPQDHVETEPVETGAEQPAQSQSEDDLAKLRNKYSSLRGKYDAEVPRLHSRNKELEGQLQQLLEENKSLRGEIASTQTKAFLTDKDTETYGEDMVHLVRRGAREEAAKYAAEAAELKTQIQQLKRQLDSATSASAAASEDMFYAKLTQEFPAWAEQNTDKGFLEWLNTTDPVYGFVRNSALQGAFERRDAHAVAEIFKAYKDQSARQANPLNRQVTPTHTRGAAPAGGQPKTWSQSEISAFYEKWRRNEISDEAAHKLEMEINDAVASGRVVA